MPIVPAVAIALVPPPPGLEQHAWYYFAPAVGLTLAAVRNWRAAAAGRVTPEMGTSAHVGLLPCRSID